MTQKDIEKFLKEKLIGNVCKNKYDDGITILGYFKDFIKQERPDFDINTLRVAYSTSPCVAFITYKGVTICPIKYTRTVVAKQNRDPYGIYPKKSVYAINSIKIETVKEFDFDLSIKTVNETISHNDSELTKIKSMAFDIYLMARSKYPDISVDRLQVVIRHLNNNFYQVAEEADKQ